MTQIHFNQPALFAHRQIGLNSTNLAKSLERLSSGYRINSASDDAAGLAVSERLRGQVRGLGQALRNIQDGISLIQTAEAGLQEMTNILQRMRELMIQAANGIYNNSDRALIQLEVDQLLNEVNRMSTAIEFNRNTLLDGTYSSTSGTPIGGGTFVGSAVFHVGANKGATVAFFISTMSVRALGLNSMFSSASAVEGSFTSGVTSAALTRAKANSSLSIVDSALNTLMRQRARLGAIENRLQSTYSHTAIAHENMASAESRIRDTDMAAEIVEFTKQQILVQAATSMLAQANLQPQLILQLL